LPTAGDPDDVAADVEGCLGSGSPPARIAVGADAEHFEQLVHSSTADQRAAMLEDFVSQLMAAGSSSASPSTGTTAVADPS
jgi:hypothetical protein